MRKFIPAIVTVDQVIGSAKILKTIVINGQPYVARHCHGRVKTPYYTNIAKRIIAAGYVLFGKGMVVRYSEDEYKASEIKTVSYK